MPESGRTYTEKEIHALLERTAQLQAEEAESSDKSRQGLNLTELEMIARDAGLDPQFLHRAALELEHAGGKPLGKNKTKTHVRVDRVLPSDLTDEEWEDVVFALKRRFESDSYDMSGMGMGSYGRGVVEQIGRSREWRHTSMSGVQTTVLFRPHKQGTSMEISQRVGIGSTKTESWAYGLPFALLFAIITGAVLKSALIGSAAMVGWTALLVPLIYYLDNRWREKKHNQLVEVADELQHIVTADLNRDKASNAEERDRTTAEPAVASSESQGAVEADSQRAESNRVRLDDEELDGHRDGNASSQGMRIRGRS